MRISSSSIDVYRPKGPVTYNQGHYGVESWISWLKIKGDLKQEETEKTDMIKDRPSFEEVYMQFAETIARRSTCKRLSVGTVITTTDYRKVLAVGYNGNASGLENTCDRDEPGNCGCLHSEENAVINCDAPRETRKLVFVTHLPCAACAKRLINLGNVEKVVYGNSYRKTDAINVLEFVGIKVRQFL